MGQGLGGGIRRNIDWEQNCPKLRFKGVVFAESLRGVRWGIVGEKASPRIASCEAGAYDTAGCIMQAEFLLLVKMPDQDPKAGRSRRSPRCEAAVSTMGERGGPGM